MWIQDYFSAFLNSTSRGILRHFLASGHCSAKLLFAAERTSLYPPVGQFKLSNWLCNGRSGHIVLLINVIKFIINGYKLNSNGTL